MLVVSSIVSIQHAYIEYFGIIIQDIYSRWLDEGEDDFLIERVLEPTKGAFWTITTVTGKHKNASPNCQLVIVLYGDNDKSQEIPVAQDPEKSFKSGETENFEVSNLFGNLVKCEEIHLNTGNDCFKSHHAERGDIPNNNF